MTFDKWVRKINFLIAIGNIINLVLFPIAVYQWHWTQDDPKLMILGHISMFLIGWMTSTYIMFLFKEKKDERNN